MPRFPTKAFSRIFISYRRDDSGGHAGRLSDKLSDRFGQDQIFMDLDDIQPGEDFVQVIENAVGSCDVLIAVIGRRWLSSSDGTSRRLDNPNDFVRVEIAAALERGVRVIPVLVQRASMPKPDDLPDELTKLATRNAIELTDARWQRDVEQLVNAIEKILQEQGKLRPAGAPVPERLRRHRALFIAAAALLFVIAIGFVWLGRESTKRNRTNEVALANVTLAGSRSQDPQATPAGMVHVPAAEFMMGRDDGEGNNPNERPAHLVAVAEFFIDQHEITADEYAEFVQTGYAAPADWKNGRVPESGGRKPVTNVKWDDANAYCSKHGKRLPSEAEWELAARGPRGYIYPWGNGWEAGLANVHTKELADVGKFPGLTPYGATDMVGNAWEWTASALTAYPNGALSEQPNADVKVIRGGSYIDSPAQATTTYRVGYPARLATDYSKIGFRCVSDATAARPQ